MDKISLFITAGVLLSTGKFAVIMADPPWDIHMELPYGTMSDDEMRQLNIPIMQDEGLIFLWVTGRLVHHILYLKAVSHGQIGIFATNKGHFSHNTFA